MARVNEFSISLAAACHMSTSLLQRIEGDGESTRTERVEVVLSFFEAQGFVFAPASITLTAYVPTQETATMTPVLSDKTLYDAFAADPTFRDSLARWAAPTRADFFSVVRALHKAGLDIWPVNMKGEVRAGAKGVQDQKGRPFAFIQPKKEGFTFDWHRGIKGYAGYISQFPASFGHGTLVDHAFVEQLEAAVCRGVDLPPLLRSLSKGRLPSDYLLLA